MSPVLVRPSFQDVVSDLGQEAELLGCIRNIWIFVRVDLEALCSVSGHYLVRGHLERLGISGFGDTKDVDHFVVHQESAKRLGLFWRTRDSCVSSSDSGVSASVRHIPWWGHRRRLQGHPLALAAGLFPKIKSLTIVVDLEPT